ncbi:MAG TPA: BamA/TamA family outer membrane protein [Flavobacteriales bacterium]|nr:BamA/TamA family outer membrane protein [Flavobacteriales bacterium]HMR26578.1 BamA/TamA family outer membrane protein [Flavobacteriales bacterium]
MSTVRHHLLAIGAIAFLLSGCRGLRDITPEDPLFVGHTVHWEGAAPGDRKALERQLEGLIAPSPNLSFLGMRPRVVLHNAIRREPRRKRGLSYHLKYRVGHAPVRLSKLKLDPIRAAQENRLQNHGFFEARVEYEVHMKGRTSTVDFHVNAGPAHRYRTVVPPGGEDTLRSAVREQLANGAVKAGDRYDLDLLRSERARIVQALQDRGWWRLRAENLLWVADTLRGDTAIDLRIVLDSTGGPEPFIRYRIGEVYVHGDHDALLAPNDTVLVDGVHYISYLNYYRPRTILNGVFIRPGDRYSRRRVARTSSYLSSYGVFQSVDVDLAADSLRSGIVDVDLRLTPVRRWSLFAEQDVLAKSNQFAGPALRVGFKDRDVFRGAEVLSTDLKVGFEAQIGRGRTGTYAFLTEATISLMVPRIEPFHLKKVSRSYVPHTKVDLKVGTFDRIDLYGLTTLGTTFGYGYRQTRRLWHDLTVVDLGISQLSRSSSVFEEFLAENPVIRRSFQEQFILGSGYTITYAYPADRTRRYHGDLRGGVEVAGNLLHTILRAVEPADGDAQRVFGIPISRFVRFMPEARLRWAVGRRQDVLAFRLLAGVGIPIGEDAVMPYSRQFFVGGPYSLRAFRSRGVGPGAYDAANSPANTLIDQVGDIKFEVNAEYRFGLIGYFKGALFVDAGNVWLLREDPQRPGGSFAWDRMLDELAVGAGAGLRFDADFIVARLDLGVPLRRPSLPAGDRWTFDDQDPRLFRNVVFNLAIGYPF